MSFVDIDVVAKGGKKDLALKAFREDLEKEAALAKTFGVANKKLLIKDFTTVYDMVTQIISKIGSRRIRRLRIYGHGSLDTLQVGPFLRTGRGRRIDPVDQTKAIQIIKIETRTKDGRLVKKEYGLLNKPALEKLKKLFDSRGWVELHSCRVVGKDGIELIKALAKLWQREVHASEDKQTVAGGLGFQGSVWIAKPGKEPFRNPSPQKKPFGARYDPLREATHRLQVGRTAISPMPPGTKYSDIYSRKTFRVDTSGTHIQTGSMQRLATRRVSPTMQSFQARYDPLRAAVLKLS